MIIWHNPRCSKSRQTLALLQERGVDPVIVKYLESAPSADEITQVLGKLGLEPRQIMRTGEKVYKETGLAGISDAKTLIAAMVENPILIERPIVIDGNKAVIGRPPEAVSSLF